MRVYKPTRKGPRGATIPYKLWYIELRDHRGIIRRLSAFTDRVASDELGRKLERLAALRATGEPPDRELARAIEGWPARLREKLERIGMLDAHAAARAGAIEVHVEAFVASLDARERTAQHVARTGSRLRAVLGGIGAHKWGELSAEAVERHMRGLREGGLSARAVNLYLQAVRQFARWMVRTGRAVEDPLRTLTPLNVRADRRRVRRALGVEELRALLYATAGEPERFGLDGQTRALIYRTAVETGLRAGELQTLRVAGLESLDGERPTVRVRAIDSKHRREDLLPLRPELARALLAHTSGRGPWEPVFPLPKAWRSAEMLRADLDAAGIAHEDESGRVVDFHALRTTFCTMLARAGVAPKVAQRLARHATFAMTFDVYAKLGADDEREALAVLPDLDAPEREAARGTGTSGEMRPGSVARCVALRGGPHETEGASGSETPPDGEPETAFAGGPCRTRTCDQAIMSRPL